MTNHEVLKFLERLKYKPGWSFHGRFEAGYLVFRIIATVPCSDTKSLTNIAHQDMIKAKFKDEGHLTQYVKARLRIAENHELDEWFRLDGERVTEPHPEYKPFIYNHSASVPQDGAWCAYTYGKLIR